MHESDLAIEATGLEASFVTKGYWGGSGRRLRAVRGLDLFLPRGEVVALVGESGCGKTTVARMLLGLLRPTSGSVKVMGKPLSDLRRQEIAKLVQPVFQNPYFSLNPYRRVADIIALPIVARGEDSAADRRRKVAEMMDLVGLEPSLAVRFPSELSGGQRQRVAIARALVAGPQVVICDEPTSALDVSVQAQILNLLQDLRTSLNLSYLLVTHNMAVVRHIADRVAVMYCGRIVEEGETDKIFSQPRHPYTNLLLSSVLSPDTSRRLPPAELEATPLNPFDPPPGCPFHPRCGSALSSCTTVEPKPEATAGASVACHHPVQHSQPA